MWKWLTAVACVITTGAALAAAALMLIATPADAAETVVQEGVESTRDLLYACKGARGGNRNIDIAFCVGYFKGFYDMSLIYMVHMKDAGEVVVPMDPFEIWKSYFLEKAICIDPMTITGIDQLMRVFTNWAERNPEKWAEPKGIGAYRALKEAYPCK